jgi:hypothetical protein
VGKQNRHSFKITQGVRKLGLLKERWRVQEELKIKSVKSAKGWIWTLPDEDGTLGDLGILAVN